MPRNHRHQTAPWGAKSFDKENLAKTTDLRQQVTIVGSILDTAKGVKEALDLRKAARERAYADAHENAKVAAANYKSAQLATQTLLDGLKKSKLAQMQARNIREEFAKLAKRAYQAAEAVSRVTDAVDTLAKDVHERVGKNELITTPVRAGVEQAKADAKTTLDAVLDALKDSIRAFAAASVAADIAADPLTLGEDLLGLLLTEEDKKCKERREKLKAKQKLAGEQPTDAEKPQTAAQENAELADYRAMIQEVDPLKPSKSQRQTMQQVVPTLERPDSQPDPESEKPQPGLLDLLSDVKTVTQRRDTICQEALTVASLETNSAQSELDRSKQKLDLLQAALRAAGAALG